MVPPPVRPPQSLARVAAAAPGLSLGNWAGRKFLWHSDRGCQSYRNCLQSLNRNWTQDCVCPATVAVGVAAAGVDVLLLVLLQLLLLLLLLLRLLLLLLLLCVKTLNSTNL